MSSLDSTTPTLSSYYVQDTLLVGILFLKDDLANRVNQGVQTYVVLNDVKQFLLVQFVSAWISSWHLKFNKLNWTYLHSSPLCTPHPSTLNFTKLNPSFILSIIQAWNFGGFFIHFPFSLATRIWQSIAKLIHTLWSWFILFMISLDYSLSFQLLCNYSGCVWHKWSIP